MSNETPITVYFESGSHAEIAAKFADENIYHSCLPTLEEYAEEARMHVTDSVDMGMDKEVPPGDSEMAIRILYKSSDDGDGYSYFTMKKGNCYYAIIFPRGGFPTGSERFANEEDAASYACGYIEGHRQANRKE